MAFGRARADEGERPAACYLPVTGELSPYYPSVIAPVIFPLSVRRSRSIPLEFVAFSHWRSLGRRRFSLFWQL